MAILAPRLLATFLLLVAAAHAERGLSCYECGNNNHQCYDPVGNPGLLPSKDCADVHLLGRIGAGDQAGAQGGQSQHQGPHGQSQASPVCYKIIFKPEHDNPLYTVERGCGILGKKKSCDTLTKDAETAGLKVYKCLECVGNLCNGATRGTSLALPLLLVAPFLLARALLR